MDFERVAILGGGLLGGSLAWRLQSQSDTRLWARREETVGQARDLGIRGATTDLAAALKNVDLVVLAVPVGAMAAVMDSALQAGLRRDVLVTDVGSVKQLAHQSLAPLIRRGGLSFIGSHPMAGREHQGISASTPDLFQGAMCLLTNDDAVPEPWPTSLEHFWKGIDCSIAWMTAKAHDALVARISHLPHLMAAATCQVALARPEDGSFAGGGLRDTTRVAAGEPEMWAEILLENSTEVTSLIRQTRESLGELLANLEAGDHAATRRWLDRARLLRARGITTQWHDN